MRDLSIVASYMGATDEVRATAIWAELTDVKHTNGDVLWNDVDPQVATTLLNNGNAIGLLPPANGVQNPQNVYINNNIALRFFVGPAGIESEMDINFDIARQRESRVYEKPIGQAWQQSNAVLPNGQPASTNYPAVGELPNDDPLIKNPQTGAIIGDIDESDRPNQNGHMFVVDGPGKIVIPGEINQFEAFDVQSNFMEWVRVSFGPSPIDGEQVRGSRASDRYQWTSRVKLERIINAQGNPEFVRVLAPNQNPATRDTLETTYNFIDVGQQQFQNP